MTPLSSSIDRPDGKEGLTLYWSTVPDTAGVSTIASPTTAGKGIDPLEDNFGVANEACPPSPHAAMSKTKAATDPQERNMTIPLWRCGGGDALLLKAPRRAWTDSARRWLPLCRKISGKAPATLV